MPKKKYAIGLMSGTSCDGMSGALVQLWGARPHVRLVAMGTIHYLPKMQKWLLRMAANKPVPVSEVSAAREFLANQAFDVVSWICAKKGFPLRRVAVIGSHGQTLYHDPDHRFFPTTFQADNLSLIAEQTGITTVGDFRSADVAAGGQGAPLAPYGHWVLFTHPREDRIILNLGGIANVTWLPARGRAGDVRGFDTGPANMLMDALAKEGTRNRLACDMDGRLAEKGIVNKKLLRQLLAHPYFKRKPPKSTGRELFGKEFVKRFKGGRLEDRLATATALTAAAVAQQIDRWLPSQNRRAVVYVSGGGAKNPVLMKMLSAELAPRRVANLRELGYPEQALEPVCFALLAYARLQGRVNTMPRVTGARRAVIAGSIILGSGRFPNLKFD